MYRREPPTALQCVAMLADSKPLQVLAQAKQCANANRCRRACRALPQNFDIFKQYTTLIEQQLEEFIRSEGLTVKVSGLQAQGSQGMGLIALQGLLGCGAKARCARAFFWPLAWASYLLGGGRRDGLQEGFVRSHFLLRLLLQKARNEYPLTAMRCCFPPHAHLPPAGSTKAHWRPRFTSVEPR